MAELLLQQQNAGRKASRARDEKSAERKMSHEHHLGQIRARLSLESGYCDPSPHQRIHIQYCFRRSLTISRRFRLVCIFLYENEIGTITTNSHRPSADIFRVSIYDSTSLLIGRQCPVKSTSNRLRQGGVIQSDQSSPGYWEILLGKSNSCGQFMRCARHIGPTRSRGEWRSSSPRSPPRSRWA